MRRVAPGVNSQGPLRVLGGVSVGPRERVVLVRYRDQEILIGLVSNG